jgi:hypothetical protein
LLTWPRGTPCPQLALGWDEQSRLAAAAGGQHAAHQLPGGDAEAGPSGGSSIGSRVGWSGPFWAHAAVQVRGVCRCSRRRRSQPCSRSIHPTKASFCSALLLAGPLQVLATAAALPISVGLGVLLVWNATLFLRNQTTIEYHEGGWVMCGEE